MPRTARWPATPRIPAEILGANVINQAGIDVTQTFTAGAHIALKLAIQHGCTEAILKSRSLSYGCGSIYDGTFQQRLIPGNGLLAKALLHAGFTMYSEETLKKCRPTRYTSVSSVFIG